MAQVKATFCEDATDNLKFVYSALSMISAQKKCYNVRYLHYKYSQIK